MSYQPDRSPHKAEPEVLEAEGLRQGPRWLRWLKRTIIALLVVVILALVGGGALIFYNLSKLSVNPWGFGPLAADSSGRTNILVLGIGDPGHAGEFLSDSMMLISIDRPKHEVAMVSIPRDLRVDIPGYGYTKINAADAVGGPSLSEQTVTSNLGVPINYYVRVDFNGLEQLVDAVGGIEVTVTQPLIDPEYPCSANESEACGLNLQPGTYHMNGAQALEYSRCRKGTCGNDFGRDARQQEVVTKIRQKIFTPGIYLNPAHDNAVLTAIRNNTKTNLTVDNLIRLGWAMQHSKRTINFVFSTSPGGYLSNAVGSSDLVPTTGNFSAMSQYLQNIFQ